MAAVAEAPDSAGKVIRLREEVAVNRTQFEADGHSTNMIHALEAGLQAARDNITEHLSFLSAFLDQAAKVKEQMEARDAQLEMLRAADERCKAERAELQELVAELKRDNVDLKAQMHDPAIQRTTARANNMTGRKSKSECLDSKADKAEKLVGRAEETHAGHGRHDPHDNLLLPLKLRGFTTLMEMNNVQQLSKAPELAQAEKALQVQPDSAEAAHNLEALLSALSQRLQKNIDAKLREEGVKRSCIEVVEAGNAEFLDVYNSVWKLIKNNEEEGLAEYRAAVNKAVCSGEACKQRSDDVIHLYSDAARTKVMHDPLIQDLLSGHSLDVPAEMSIPPDLKKTARVLEKSHLRADAPGNPDRVCDIVRTMVIAKSMQDLAKVVLKFVHCKDIVLVRVKERFEKAPTSGGWRDCNMNFYLRNDPAKHICEVQLAHQTLLTARKGLPGHVIYNRVRNASELLEALENCQVFGLSILDARTSGLSVADCKGARFEAVECKCAGWTATDCRNAGFSANECHGAGFTAHDFKKAGFTLADCKDVGFELKSCSYAGYSFVDCKQAGFSAFDCKHAGATAQECKQSGYSPAECREAGFNAMQLSRAHFSAADLFTAGFCLRDCIDQAGFSARECRAAGFSCSSFKSAGMAAGGCASAGFSLADIFAAGYPAHLCKKAGYSLAACLRAGYSLCDCRSAGFTVEQCREEGMTACDFKKGGCSAEDCRNAGFNPREVKEAGYDAAECLAGGYLAADCKAAGFSVVDFKSAGLSAAHCKEAGFTARDCKSGGFLASDCRGAGFSASQCYAAGFAKTVCLTAGFSQAECDEAGIP